MKGSYTSMLLIWTKWWSLMHHSESCAEKPTLKPEINVKWKKTWLTYLMYLTIVLFLQDCWFRTRSIPPWINAQIRYVNVVCIYQQMDMITTDRDNRKYYVDRLDSIWSFQNYHRNLRLKTLYFIELFLGDPCIDLLQRLSFCQVNIASREICLYGPWIKVLG